VGAGGGGGGGGEKDETAVEETQNIRSVPQPRDEGYCAHICAEDQFTFFLILIKEYLI